MKHASPHELCGPGQGVEEGHQETPSYTPGDGAATYLNGEPIQADAIGMDEAPGLEEIALVPSVVFEVHDLFASIARAPPDSRHAVWREVAGEVAALACRGLADWPLAADWLTNAAQAHGLVREAADVDKLQGDLAAAWRGAVAADAAAVDRRPKRPAPAGKSRLISREGVASAAELQNAQDEMFWRRRNGEPAASTIDAFKYVVSLKSSDGLRAWLARRSADEVRFFRNMVISK